MRLVGDRRPHAVRPKAHFLQRPERGVERMGLRIQEVQSQVVALALVVSEHEAKFLAPIVNALDGNDALALGPHPCSQ